MSQSLLIKGTYKNNKTNSIGCHNPQNNRNFNNEEITHIHNMFDKHFKDKINKFKLIEVYAHVEGEPIFHRVITTVNLDIINDLINDIVNII